MAYQNRDYATMAKWGFVLGAAMFILEIAGHFLLNELPALGNTILVDMMGLGLLIAFVSVFGVGVILPLVR
ncbi:MAG: hypothetical protein SXQ77_09510 [Halobacteria archaeon]|nr:hypothetical protein [Halobacteria archaeon]